MFERKIKMITLILRNPEAVKARIAEDEKKSELVQKNLTEAYQKIQQAQKILVSYNDRGFAEAILKTYGFDSNPNAFTSCIVHSNATVPEPTKGSII